MDNFPVRNMLIAGTGAIGCALLPAWVVWLKQLQVRVQVVLSRGAERFVTLESLSALTGRTAVGESNLERFIGRSLHVELAEWAEVMVVAPATANTIAKLANGIADNFLCTVVLNSSRPVVVAPSLSGAAVGKPVVRRNLERLALDGYGVVPTFPGAQVGDGKVTPGGMADAPTVFEFTRRFLVAGDNRLAHGQVEQDAV